MEFNMATRQMTTSVSRPGSSERGTLRELVPAGPRDTDRVAYKEAVQRLEEAERSAEEQSRAIKIH
jgi:hypothetical protein